MFDTMLATIVTWVAAIVIIVFLIFIIKDIYEIFKGQGSILKCVGKVIFVFVMVGIIFACRKYNDYGESFSQTAEKAIDAIGNESSDLFE